MQEVNLEAVYSKPPSCLFIPILQVRDDAVVYILFLFAQKVRRHSIQAVAGELVVPNDGPHDIELDAPLHSDLLVVMRAMSLAAEGCVLHSQLAAASIVLLE